MKKNEIIEALTKEADLREWFANCHNDRASRAAAIREAVELLKAVPEWISVKDRMPNPGERVIVTDGCFVDETHAFIGGISMLWALPDDYHVTYWMPMPKPQTKKDKAEIIESLTQKANLWEWFAKCNNDRASRADANCVEAIREAVEMLKAAPEWISVKEGLPEQGSRVIATDGCFVGEAYTFIAFGSKCMNFPIGDYVTHWMPIPNPPKEEIAHEKD